MLLAPAWGPLIDGLGAVVGCERSDEVTNPPEDASRANPESGCHDKPEKGPDELSIVNLTHAWNHEA